MPSCKLEKFLTAFLSLNFLCLFFHFIRKSGIMKDTMQRMRPVAAGRMQIAERSNRL